MQTGLAKPEKRLRNWQAFIYAKIDSTILINVVNVKQIMSEIEKCYCYEFATDAEYIAMVEYLEERAKKYIADADREHEMRMQKIRNHQARRLSAASCETARRSYHKLHSQS